MLDRYKRMFLVMVITSLKGAPSKLMTGEFWVNAELIRNLKCSKRAMRQKLPLSKR